MHRQWVSHTPATFMDFSFSAWHALGLNRPPVDDLRPSVSAPSAFLSRGCDQYIWAVGVSSIAQSRALVGQLSMRCPSARLPVWLSTQNLRLFTGLIPAVIVRVSHFVAL